MVVMSLPAATATAVAQACTEPYGPLAWAQTYPAGETLPAVPGVDVSSQLVVAPLDSDGDGVSDTFPADGSAAVVRGDGTVTFESSGNLVRLANPANAGDLDGDGRDEILLHVLGATGDAGTWLVPGTVSPGTHDVSTVGIRINGFLEAPVADRTGDGIDDLMQSQQIVAMPLTTITSGAAIMAVGAGGDARSVAPVVSIPGSFVAFAQLSSGPPAIITAAHVDDAVEFRIADESSAVVFTTAPAPDLSDQFGVHISNVLVSDVGTYMIGATGSRSGIESYLWRVDQPCEPLVETQRAPLLATEPAPPVVTQPAFTG